MGDEEAKRIVLARRARFVAAALAGLNAAMCGGKSDGGNPQPCLDFAFEDGSTPQPCLSPRQEDGGADTGADAAVDADSSDDADAPDDADGA